ncbi:GNAT family N-acetyltransferase [Patescibacteria group bacterium]|nr:GNAT family N-acetyltransferase [Patescibacteria group bacterium]
MEIRYAKLDEINKVTEVTQKAYAEPYDDTGRISGFTENPDLESLVKSGQIKILVAVDDSKIIGTVRYEFREDNSVYISKLSVLKKYRNQGVAKDLISRVESESRNKGVEVAKLDFMQEKNLQLFYESLGYEVKEAREHGNHHDVFVEKRIV